MSENKKINSKTKHLILCEGRDEKLFFIWFLDYFKNKSSSDYDKYNEIQIEDIGGNADFVKQLSVWKLVSDFENLKTVGIIRDAETDSSGALQSIQHCFSCNDLPQPQDCFELTEGEDGGIRTVFGILPGTKTGSKWDNGTLEDLCLKILKDPQSSEKIISISKYLDQAQNDFKYKINHMHKAKLHTYFSSNEPFIGSKIGEAAKRGAFNFESDILINFKKMFDDMVK
ncbi:MAG: hypothetical protein K2K57_03095 [Oscillospiraceae bacterium]|nr:hypothetical protein [Oscillospiraceae bacterium]